MGYFTFIKLSLDDVPKKVIIDHRVKKGSGTNIFMAVRSSKEKKPKPNWTLSKLHTER